MSIASTKEQAKAGVANARADLVEISLDIHAHPELAMEEKRASGLLADRLEARGFAVERGAFGLDTAFRARWGEGPVTIAYLCEYDALPEIVINHKAHKEHKARIESSKSWCSLCLRGSIDGCR